MMSPYKASGGGDITQPKVVLNQRSLEIKGYTTKPSTGYF